MRQNYHRKNEKDYARRANSIRLNQNTLNFNINNNDIDYSQKSSLISPTQMSNSLDERMIFINPIAQSVSPRDNFHKRKSEFFPKHISGNNFQN